MILDSSVLFAAANRRDSNHAACNVLVTKGTDRFVVPALVLAEASYLLGATLGPEAETALLRSVATPRFDVFGPTDQDLTRMAELASAYQDLPLGATDASIIALAERLNDPVIATLDRRHLTVVRTALHALTLLPERIAPSRR